MKITRDGKEYELTHQELKLASEEYDLECHFEDVSSKLEESGIYGVSDDDVKSIVLRADTILSKSDLYFETYWDATEMAIKEFVEGGK